MLRKISYLFLSVLLAHLVSCTKERANSGNDIMLTCREWAQKSTRSVLTDPEIESKISSVTVAAYCDGKLFCSVYYPSGTSTLQLELSDGNEYRLYAIANLPDQSDALPQDESGINSLTCKLASYAEVDKCGFPMSGSATCTGGDPGTTIIQMKRLFAKVIAHLSCDYPDAVIESVRICNLNSRMSLFGESRASSGSDMLSGCEQSTGNTDSGEFILYIPENMQGSIGAADTPRKKNPDTDPAINAARARLTYLETLVRMKDSNGQYSGTVTYRTYAGNNAVDNFDIEGNCVYDWYITFYEDNLQTNDWKTDTGSLSDKRYISVKSPYFALPGEKIALSCLVESNIKAENLLPDISDDDGICSGTSLSNVSEGYVIIDPTASPGKKAVITVTPRFNAKSISGKGEIVVYIPNILLKGGPLSLNPDDATSGTLEVEYRHLFGKYRESERLTGRRDAEWTHSLDNPLISPSFDDASDRITYTLSPKASPGVFKVKVAANDWPVSDSVFITVSDTRYMCTDGTDPVHPAYGGKGRITSIKKSRIDVSSIWQIGYNWGQMNAGLSKQYWKFGESVYSTWHNHIEYKLEGVSEGYLTQGFDYPFTSTFTISKDIPKGEYKFYVWWKDVPSIRDSATLRIVGTDVEAITVYPSSVKMLKGQTCSIKATIAPSDADCKEIVWECDSDCISISQDGTVTALARGSATAKAKAADGSGSAGKVLVEVCELQVKPSSQAVILGKEALFSSVIISADGEESDVSTSCVWKAEDSDIATSLTDGKFRSDACGTTAIYASYTNIYGKTTAAGSLSVSELPTEKKYRITLSPTSGTFLEEGESITMEVRLYTDIWTDGTLTHTDTVGEVISNDRLDWTTPDGGKCSSITSEGKATGLKAGEETIRAALKSYSSVAAESTLYVNCRLYVDNEDWEKNNKGGDNY